jgi:type IV secretion system protein TrbG
MRTLSFIPTVVALLAVTSIYGQTQPPTNAPATAPTSPVPLKRVAPQTTPTGSQPVPTPDKYPFTNLVNVLQNGDPPASSPPAPKSRVDKGAHPEAPPTSPNVPKDFQPDKDVPLTDAARDAVKVSETWMLGNQAPVEGKDGRVLYTYGAGLPTVVCAPLRVCVLELQPGEKIVGEPHIGDSVRWIVSPASSGKDELAVAMIIIKPKSAGLDTNLFVTTDRRAYYLRLISKPEDYIARVAFAYPDDDEAKWKAYLSREQEQRRKEEFEASQIAPVETLENLYFNYTIQGGDQNIRPVRVVDDGKKTYIQMPPETAHRDLPTLAVLGPDGKAELVNYRVKADMYIVDRIFDRGALILGTGKKAQRAEIIRGTASGKKLRNDPFGKIVPEQSPSATSPLPTAGPANRDKPGGQEN